MTDLIVTCECGQKNRVVQANADKTVLCGACKEPLDTWAAALTAAAQTSATSSGNTGGLAGRVAQVQSPPADPRGLLEAIATVVRDCDPDREAADALEDIAELLMNAGFDVANDGEDEGLDDQEDDDDDDEGLDDQEDDDDDDDSR